LGSTASKGATVAVKIGARIAAGSAAGATSGAICEGAKVLKGEEVSWESLGKSVAIGAVAGSVGGASTSIAHSSVCKPVADVIGRPAMRVITQAGTSMATDAGVQLATTGEIDPKLLLANTTGQVVCGATAEAASSIASSSRQDKHQIKEPSKNDRPDRPGRPDKPDRPGGPKPSDNLLDQKPFKEKTNYADDSYSKKSAKTIDLIGKDHGNKHNREKIRFINKYSEPEILKSSYAEDLYSPKSAKTNDLIGKDHGNLRYAGKNHLDAPKMVRTEMARMPDHLMIAEKNKANFPKIVKMAPSRSATVNNLRSDQINYLFTDKPSENKNQKLESRYSPEKLECLIDLLDIHKSHKNSIINRESVARALKILRNTDDPELYAILLQYNIPMDMIGIEATRLMLEQIFEEKIKIEVTFNDRVYVFGTNESQNTKVIRLDLINGHFINELQDGASALYNDCFYYATAEDFPDILIMTPDEMRRNISDVIKSNDRIRSIISNRDHSFYIDMGFFGGREARRELNDARKDPKAFWKIILELLKNPEGRDHSYDAIDRDFPGRFDNLYEVPLEIDHILPVNVWIRLFIHLKELISSGHPHQKLLRMFKILTGLDDPTELTVKDFRALVKKQFPCIILTGLVHRNLLTTNFSFTTMGFCGLLVHSLVNDNFEEALKMVFQDHHNTTIHFREEFPRVIYPQTLSEELDILHTWQRSLVDFYLRMQLIDEQQAKFLFEVIDNFPTEDYNKLRVTFEGFMIFPPNYEEMYGKRDLLLSDDEKNKKYKNDQKDKKDK